MELTLEQQRAIAMARARARAAATARAQEQQRPSGNNPLGFINRGIGQALDAPFDLSSAVARAVGDAVGYDVGPNISPVSRGMDAAGINLPDRPAETLGERAAEGFGMAAGSLPLLGAGAAAAAAGGAPRTAQAVMNPFVQTPRAAMQAELAAGAGAGVGGKLAEDATGSDNPLVRAGGELAGGLVAAAGPQAAARAAGAIAEALPITGTAIRGIKAGVAPFTNAGGRAVASRRLQELVGDRDAVLSELARPSEGNLTPAQQSGNERLMALERAVRERDPAIDERLGQRAQESTQQLREAVLEPAGGEVGAGAAEAMLARRERVSAALEARIRQAEETARERTASLEPARRESENSIILREELERALADARAQESQLWAAVPETEMVPTAQSMAKFEELKERLTTATQNDMPDIANLLSRGSNWAAGQQSVKEMQGLRSELLRISRNARAGEAPNTRQAGIAEQLAGAVLRDMESAPEASAPLRQALDYSRTLNERFKQGTVGRLLQRRATGGDAVPPERTLERSGISQGGTPAVVAMDDIRAAGADGGQAAVEDYVLRRFRDFAAPRGELNIDRGRDFLRQNAELLERMPGLRAEMEGAVLDVDQARGAVSRSQQRQNRLNDRRVSAGAAFVEAPIGQEIQTIFRAKNPAQAARSVAREARRDPTGRALSGLKGALLGDVTDAKSIGRLLDDPRSRAATREILEPQEYSRLQRLRSEFEKLETSQGQLQDIGGVMNNAPLSVISFIARTFAARQGAKAGAGTSGASLLTANFASQRMQRILNNLSNDRATQLVRDAIEDKDLFRALLMDASAPKRAGQVERRLTEWLIGSGVAVSDTEED